MVFLTIRTYKLPNLGRFEWEIFPNFGMSEKSEKIEPFISENLKIFGYDLNFLTRTPPPLLLTSTLSLLNWNFVQPPTCQPTVNENNFVA